MTNEGEEDRALAPSAQTENPQYKQKLGTSDVKNKPNL
jgi:hypothetical protein